MLDAVAALVIVGLGAGAAVGAGRGVRSSFEEHALAGRFGEVDRERAMARQAAALIDDAEAVVRLGAFVDVVRQHAWKGTPLRVEHQDGRWFVWRFTGDRVFYVRHQRRSGRWPAHVILCEAVGTRQGLSVRAYGKSSGFPPVDLAISDVIPYAPAVMASAAQQ